MRFMLGLLYTVKKRTKDIIDLGKHIDLSLIISSDGIALRCSAPGSGFRMHSHRLVVDTGCNED